MHSPPWSVIGCRLPGARPYMAIGAGADKPLEGSHVDPLHSSQAYADGPLRPSRRGGRGCADRCAGRGAWPWPGVLRLQRLGAALLLLPAALLLPAGLLLPATRLRASAGLRHGPTAAG